MNLDRWLALGVLGALFLVLPTLALAQPPDPNIHAIPASALIFPLFDSNPMKGTLISVTNTNTSTTSCGNGYKRGDICVHYVYVDGEDCSEFDRTECLTPGDTLTVIADLHNPHQVTGWLWVEARDPETLEPISYNHLIGSAIIVESDLDFVWAYTPYSFRALVTGGEGSDCGFPFTDVVNQGFADFNGIEYEFFPDELILDNFFEQSGRVGNEITLMSVKPFGDTNVSAIIWNNDEVPFSKGFVFECHTRGPLSLISSIVEDLGGVSGEPLERFQTGWIEFRSSYGILGVFKHSVNRAGLQFGAGHELHVDGTQAVELERFF